jgi:hypothetical protein
VRRSRQPWSKLPRAALLLTVFGFSLMAPVTQSAPAQKKPLPAPATQESKDENIEAARSELLRLLRLSPKLSLAISADPTLLADEAYVSRNNPELAEFLHNHAEVVRNPEFYLFFPNKFPARGGRPRFEATVWPELQGFEPSNIGWDAPKIIAFLVFVLILVALLWIFRLVLEHSKWNKLSKMQNELYGKLLEKCSTNEELLASFRGSTGKPFSDLTAIEPPTSNPLARVFLLLQFGIVLTLAGGISLGFLYARAGDPRAGDARFLLGLGTLVFALGIGLIISAVVSYLLARHLGLLPQRDKAKETGASENTTGG